MRRFVRLGDRFGSIHPAIGPYASGLSRVEELLGDCGIAILRAEGDVEARAGHPSGTEGARALRAWIEGMGLTALGFGAWLDPEASLRSFEAFMEALRSIRALAEDGGRVGPIFFAGAPGTCDLVRDRFPRVAAAFDGGETVAESMDALGLPLSLLPQASYAGVAYDEARLAFGRELAREGERLEVAPVDRGGSRRFGERGDSLVARVLHGAKRGLPPLMSADAGSPLALDRVSRLARAGLLDVLSLGAAGPRDARDLAELWSAARPMLVTARARARDAEAEARMLEDAIDIAWHALSLWRFCGIDGLDRGVPLVELREQIATLRYIAGTEKPFEPSVPPRFSELGGDDLSYVLSGLVAAKAAKAAGIQKLILPVSLNVSGGAWGIGDLSKARALLHLVRELEDGDFKVFVQARVELDYRSRDSEKARARLASAVALMDDIEPGDRSSPQLIHLENDRGGSGPADPELLEESVRVARRALVEYRASREAGAVEDMSSNPAVLARASELLHEARAGIAAIESTIGSPYCAEGLREILASGFFALPRLGECGGEFSAAAAWRTKSVGGSIVVVDGQGQPIAARERLAAAADTARSRAAKPGSGP